MGADHVRVAGMVWRMARVRRSIKRDPNARAYMDTALAPVADDDVDTLEMFSVTDSARATAERTRRTTVSA